MTPDKKLKIKLLKNVYFENSHLKTNVNIEYDKYKNEI